MPVLSPKTTYLSLCGPTTSLLTVTLSLGLLGALDPATILETAANRILRYIRPKLGGEKVTVPFSRPEFSSDSKYGVNFVYK